MIEAIEVTAWFTALFLTIQSESHPARYAAFVNASVRKSDLASAGESGRPANAAARKRRWPYSQYVRERGFHLSEGGIAQIAGGQADDIEINEVMRIDRAGPKRGITGLFDRQ
jgi:hypothetical protein